NRKSAGDPASARSLRRTNNFLSISFSMTSVSFGIARNLYFATMPGMRIPSSSVGRVKHILARTASEATSLACPPACRNCGATVGTDAALCVPCWNKVRFLGQPWCESLGVPFVRDPGRGALTADAIADRRVFRRARAAVAYGGPASQLVRALKFEGQT